MNKTTFTLAKAEGDNYSYIPCDILAQAPGKIGGAMACAFIFLTSLFGNLLVVTVVYRERRMRTTVNFLIVNMAVSDFLCTLFVIPKVITQTFTYQDAWFIEGTAGDALCKIVLFIQDVTVAVSLLSLLMIAIERYTAISSPLVADPIPRKRCKIMILSTWFVACLMYATHFYTFKLFVEDEGPTCGHSWEPLVANHFEAWKIEFLLHTILFVFIPFIVVTALYSDIFVRIKRSAVPGDAKSRSMSLGRRRQQTRNRNVLRTMLAVVIAFGFCWFPSLICTYVITYIWYNKKLEPPCDIIIVEKCAFYLAYFNSSINPALYFMLSENYRKGLKKLLGPPLHHLLNTPHLIHLKNINKDHQPEVQGTNYKRKEGARLYGKARIM